MKQLCGQQAGCLRSSPSPTAYVSPRPLPKPSQPRLNQRAQTFCNAQFHQAKSAAVAPTDDEAVQPINSHSQASSLSVSNLNRTPAALAAGVAAAATLLAAQPALASVSWEGDLAALLIPGIVGDSPLREGIVSGFLLIFFSEIGDKTFFIALLLALKQNKGAVYAGTFGALAVMTVISVFLGQALHQLDELIPEGVTNIPFDDLLAVALLLYFGINTIKDAKDAEESAAEEKEEAKEVVESMNESDIWKLIISTFVLVFAAEWGDKSFLATIALAAASSPTGVVTGAIAGHGVATGLAVAGGSFLSKYVSEKVLQYLGGSLFLVFAAATVVDIIAEMNAQ